LYVRDASKNWKLVQSDANNRFSLKEPSANLILLDYISSEKYRDIVDFDDHLDDISKDWLNPGLFN
ncbi:er membrane protein complex subunit 8/9, partial [Trifolium pratense]